MPSQDGEELLARAVELPAHGPAVFHGCTLQPLFRAQARELVEGAFEVVERRVRNAVELVLDPLEGRPVPRGIFALQGIVRLAHGRSRRVENLTQAADLGHDSQRHRRR